MWCLYLFSGARASSCVWLTLPLARWLFGRTMSCVRCGGRVGSGGKHRACYCARPEPIRHENEAAHRPMPAIQTRHRLGARAPIFIHLWNMIDYPVFPNSLLRKNDLDRTYSLRLTGSYTGGTCAGIRFHKSCWKFFVRQWNKDRLPAWRSCRVIHCLSNLVLEIYSGVLTLAEIFFWHSIVSQIKKWRRQSWR